MLLEQTKSTRTANALRMPYALESLKTSRRLSRSSFPHLLLMVTT